MHGLQVIVFEYPGRIEECFAVRRRVFVEEQAVTEEEEVDGLDPEALHFLALQDDEPVGAARMREAGSEVAKAERVAVLASHRRRGVGVALMRALEAEAARRGLGEVRLGAQLRALPFYAGLGYEAFGEEFMDARIPHRWMRKRLSGSAPG